MYYIISLMVFLEALVSAHGWPPYWAGHIVVKYIGNHGPYQSQNHNPSSYDTSHNYNHEAAYHFSHYNYHNGEHQYYLHQMINPADNGYNQMKPVENGAQSPQKIPMKENDFQKHGDPNKKPISPPKRPVESNIGYDPIRQHVNTEAQGNTGFDPRPGQEDTGFNPRPGQDNTGFNLRPGQDNTGFNPRPGQDNTGFNPRPGQDNTGFNPRPGQDNTGFNPRPGQSNVDVIRRPTQESIDVNQRPGQSNNDFNINFIPRPPGNGDVDRTVVSRGPQTNVNPVVDDDIFRFPGDDEGSLPSNNINGFDREPIHPSSGLRISEQKCLDYTRNCIDIPPEVGVAVIGGHASEPGEFPYIAAIGWRKSDDTGYNFFCGGSLISERYVLTAAHCAFTRSSDVVSEEPNIVRLGELDLERTDEGTETQDINITSVTSHPNYLPPSKYDDIALILLASPVVMNKFVWPLCLWPNVTDPNAGVGVAIGWGKTSFTGRTSNILLEVDLFFVDRDKCQTDHSVPNRDLRQGIQESQICAGNEYGGKDTCQGDSGGPLAVRSPLSSCTFHQVGITSFGVGCGTAIPGVYTRVGAYLDWIESIVWS